MCLCLWDCKVRLSSSKLAKFVNNALFKGAGKTTSVSKLAYYYKCHGWRVGAVAADTFRAGAYAQLQMNAAKGKFAFYGR